MQLLVLLLLFLSTNKTCNFNQVKPLLEQFGGEEVTKAFESAEQISSVISAVQSLTGGNAGEGAGANRSADPLQAVVSAFASAEKASPQASEPSASPAAETINFPLSPIIGIADEPITASLSRYISTGE